MHHPHCTRRPRPAALRGALALLAAGGLAACVAPAVPDEFGWEETAAEQTAPLGGEALAQHKQQMQRVHRDLVHFYETLDSMPGRRDSQGFLVFKRFLEAYLGQYADPLLASEWQSNHPELMALDANLRFAKAEVLLQLGASSRLGKVIREIEARYQGRESMLVDYPIGTQGSLSEALEILRSRRWRG